MVQSLHFPFPRGVFLEILGGFGKLTNCILLILFIIGYVLPTTHRALYCQLVSTGAYRTTNGGAVNAVQPTGQPGIQSGRLTLRGGANEEADTVSYTVYYQPLMLILCILTQSFC
jgi:hypothetical protein